MKKYIYIVLALFLVGGCSEEFLEKYPNTSMVIENFYKTSDDAEQAITAVYNMLLRDDYWSFRIFSEIASDNCTGGAGQGDGGGFQRVDRGIQWPDANAHQDAWATYFGGIYRANIYLAYEERIDWTGKEALRNQYLAEARFLRAYFHFYLAQVFGEIPALDKPLNPGEIPPRTPAEDLYTFILDDLKFAAQNGLSEAYGSMNSGNWGRATKWAAEAMFARVYLYYSGYYNDETVTNYSVTDARNYIDDLIANSGHSMVADYASLWKVSSLSEIGPDGYIGEVNPEVIWSIRYESTGNPFQTWARMIGPRQTNIDPYGQGWGAMPVLPSLWNAYNASDSRRTANILSWDDEGLFYDWSSSGIQQAQYTGYNVKKYEIVSIGNMTEVSDWQLNSSEDYIILRYADVLLMAAELHMLTGDNGPALIYLNEVRERAYNGDNSHNYASVTFENILEERRLELAFEGLRYWDILRSCKGDFSKLTTLLTYVDDTDGGDFSQTADVFSLDVNGNNFVATKGLFQIPQNELDLMEGIIKQNPGYVSD